MGGIRTRSIALEIRSSISYRARAWCSRLRTRVSTENQRGQAMMEYILTVIVAVAPLLIFWSILLRAMRNYIKGVYFFASLPLP